MLLENATGSEQLGVALDLLILNFAELLGTPLTFELVQERLGIKRLQMAWTAGHEQEDDRARLGRKMDRFGGERRGRSRAKLLVIEERRHRQTAEAGECVLDELPARAGRATVQERS